MVLNFKYYFCINETLFDYLWVDASNKSDQKKNKAPIINLNSSHKEQLPVYILIIKKLSSKNQAINIVMISTNVYCTAYYLKEAQVFGVLIKNI